jgi:hypothetical protein
MFSSKQHSSHKSHRSHGDRVSMSNVKVTFENLVAILNSPKYRNGIDPETMICTIDDIFSYVSGNADGRIRTPAPMDDLNDRFDFMWPEGARVSSRPPSESSRASRHSGRARHLSSKFTSGNIGPDLMRSALSVTSSQSSRRYVGFIDEEHEEPDPRSPPITYPRFPPRRRSSVTSGPGSTVKVHGAVVKPTPSIEKMFAASSITDDSPFEADLPEPEARPASTRRRAPPSGRGDRPPVSNVRYHGKAVGFED